MISPPIRRKFVGDPMTIHCIFILSGINSCLNRLVRIIPVTASSVFTGLRSACDEPLCIGTRSSLPAFFPSLIDCLWSPWTLTHIYRDTLLTQNTLKQKAFPFLQTAASYTKNKQNKTKKQGEILNHHSSRVEVAVLGCPS